MKGESKMKKIIAKSIKGQEYLYSRKYSFSVSPKKAKIICDTLNRIKLNINDSEIWFIHEIDDIEYQYTNACFQQFVAGKTGIKIRNHLSVYPGAKW